MKRSVLKWNFTVIDAETRTTVIDDDYEYHEYKLAFRTMMAHIKRPDTHRYIRRLHKVTRSERVEFPGIAYLKRLVLNVAEE